MRTDAHESEENDDYADSASDTSSSPASESRRSVDAPYRDRHDALVWQRRALAREHDEAERAVARRDRLARRLAVIDDSLREEARPLLDSLEKARPCKARWDDMEGDDVVRRCARCRHEVYDVARMTRAEAEALFVREGARLRRRADGRVIASECPSAAPSLLSRLAIAGLAGALAGGAVSVAVATTWAASIGGARSSAIEPVVFVPPARPMVRVDALRSPRLEDAVRLLGPGTYEIDVPHFERALRATSPSMPRFTPHALGLRVSGVHTHSVGALLGLRNGDLIQSVNGTPIQDLDQALDVAARLLPGELLVLSIDRQGRERVHVYHLRR